MKKYTYINNEKFSKSELAKNINIKDYLVLDYLVHTIKKNNIYKEINGKKYYKVTIREIKNSSPFFSNRATIFRVLKKLQSLKLLEVYQNKNSFFRDTFYNVNQNIIYIFYNEEVEKILEKYF